jgi:hypothetical protein
MREAGALAQRLSVVDECPSRSVVFFRVGAMKVRSPRTAAGVEIARGVLILLLGVVGR